MSWSGGSIINYDICHKHRDVLQAESFDVLICDEAHYLKSATARRTNAILGTNDEGDCEGIKSEYLWFLTGTPILNRPSDIFPLLWALNSNRWNSYQSFTKIWGSSFDEVSNYGELRRLMKPLMLKRKKVDVLHDLPPKLYSVVPLEGSEEAAAKEEIFAFEAFEVDFSAQKRNDSSTDPEKSLGEFGEGATLERYGIGERINGKGALQVLASIRSYTSGLKLEPAVKLLKQYTLCEKVVVFAHHRKVIHGLVEEFGDECVHIIGGMDAETRAEAVRRFQHDASCRLFVGSIRAAGVGLTLTASSHVVFLELDWSPSIMTQAEDRCHRVGQRDSVQVDYFVFKGTIDEWMAQQLARKSQGIRRTLDQNSSERRAHQSVYKLDFGQHRGLAVDDIPINYLKNFLIKEDVYKKRPALWNALYLCDVVDDAPLNLVQEDDTNETAGVEYTFDFGQYYGMEWSQVPQKYRDWVVETSSVWQKRIGLWIALYEGGLVEDEPELAVDNNAQISDNRPTNTTFDVEADRTMDIDYSFDFGKFNGQKWNDVDRGYRDWIIATKDVWLKRTDLWVALHKAGLLEEDPE
ncbi:hypothetical protein ACHAWF_012516 [Thalassiosira exigua]